MDHHEKEDDDLLCTYLLQFGTETIDKAACQDGEVEFLNVASRDSISKGSTQNAWSRITDAYRRRMERKAQP